MTRFRMPAKLRQPFGCATPEEAAGSHLVFTAALESQRTGDTVEVNWRD
ncbi:hypothetical protein [Cohnella kolymensis]|nr:hypothetical protein [Cohnella kolymensis]